MHIELGRELDGPARQVANLLNGLEKSHYDYSLVAVSGAEVIGAVTNQGVKINRIRQKEASGFKLVKALRKLIRYEKPDMLHIHSRPGDFAAAWAGKREKKNMVYSVRTDATPTLIDRLFKLPMFSHIIAQSQSINRVLELANISPYKRTLIPGSVDSERFKPTKEAKQGFLTEFGIRGDGPVLGIAARLAHNKGHTVLFGALPTVIAKFPGARLLVFGQGPAQKDLMKEVARRGMEKYVKFAGHRPDLEHVLPYLDLYIHPALEEGMGVVLMEASACGIPIIATRIGGIPDIVRDRFNGYMVKPGDYPGLARHIVDLLEDTDQFRLFGKTGREIAVESFSIDRMVAAHRNIYRNV